MHFARALPLVLSLTLGINADVAERSHDLAPIIEEVLDDFPCPGAPPDRFSPWSQDASAPIVFHEGDPGPAEERPRLTADAVLALVREHVAPDTWSLEGHSLAVVDTALVAVHEPSVQEEIAALLDILRAEKHAAVAVEIAIVPAAALPAAPRPGLLPESAFDEALARAGADAEHLSVTGRSREKLRVGSGTRRSVASGDEVDQRGAWPVVNPAVEEMRFGLDGEVKASLLRGHAGLRLEIDLTRLRPSGPAEKRTTFFSEYDLLPVREERVATTLSLPSGRAALAGLFSEAGADGKRREIAVLARARVQPDPRKPPDVSPEVAAWLDRHTDSPAPGVALHLEEVEGTLEDLLEILRGSGDGVELRDGWRTAVDGKAARIVRRASLTGVPGHPMTLRAFDARPYVGDVDHLSMSCSSDRSMAVPCPRVEMAGAGLTAKATLRETLEPGLLRVELDLEAGQVSIGSRATLLAPAEIGEAPTPGPPWAGREEESGAPGARPWIHLPYEIDLPRHDVLDLEGNFILPAGRSSLIHVEDSRDGRARLLIATAAAEEIPAVPAAEEARVFDLDLVARRLLEPGEISVDAGLRATDEVAMAIPSLIFPETWNGDPNGIGVDGARLTVTGAPEALAEAARFVGRLEASAARRVRIDLALVPVDALDAAAPGWDRPGAAPWLDGAAFDRALALASGRGAFSAGAARLGTWRRFEPRTRALHVTDHDVSGLSATPVLYWVLDWKREGLQADVLLLPSPAGTWFRAEWDIRRERPAAAPERRRLPWGDVELTRDRVEALRGAAPFPREKALVLGVFSPGAAPPAGGGPEGFAGLLRVRGPATGDANPDRGDSVRLLDVALLSRPLPASSPPADPLAPPARDDGEEEPPGVLAEEEAIGRLVAAAIGGDDGQQVTLAPLGPQVAFRATAERHERAAASLDAEARRRAPLVQVELWRLTADARDAARLRDLDLAALTSLAGTGIVRVRTAAFPGGAAVLHAVTRRAYVGGVRKMSGTRFGTPVEASDPDVRHAEEGIHVVVRAVLEGSDRALLSLRGWIAGAPRFGPTRRARVEPMIRLEEKAGPAGTRVVEEWIEIELPEMDVEEWRSTIPVPLGRPVVLSVLPAAGEPGRVHVLAALVTLHEVEGPQ